MTNYESGRAFALSSISQETLHNPEAFKVWTDNFVAALRHQSQPVYDSNAVTIYTDGACTGNPGVGGWGAVLMLGEHKREISGFVPQTTNNRMELYAVINALSALKRPCAVTLHSDSAYVVRAFTNGWLTKWQHNGWKNSRKDPVENQDLWLQLLELTNRHHVTFVKVKGHADDEFNNRCDQLATAAIREMSAE